MPRLDSAIATTEESTSFPPTSRTGISCVLAPRANTPGFLKGKRPCGPQGLGSSVFCRKAALLVSGRYSRGTGPMVNHSARVNPNAKVLDFVQLGGLTSAQYSWFPPY